MKADNAKKLSNFGLSRFFQQIMTSCRCQLKSGYQRTLLFAFLVLAVSFLLDSISYFGPLAKNGRILERSNLNHLNWHANTADLPAGDYYIAIGRVRGPCDLKVDDNIILSSSGSDNLTLQRLVLGAPIKINSNEHHEVSVICKNITGFKGGLADAPQILPLSLGISLELYRYVLYLAMGVIANLFLLMEGAFPSYVLNKRGDNGRRKLWFTTSVFALLGLIYSLSIDRLPLLYFGTYSATCIHILIRSVFALAFFEIITVFQDRSKAITTIYLVLIIADLYCFVAFRNSPGLVVSLYKWQYPIYSLTTAYIWLKLIRITDESGMLDLLQIVTGCWAIAQAVDCYFVMFDFGFYKSPLVSVIMAIGISLIRRKLMQNIQVQLDLSVAYSQVVSQVSHDIRSPVAVLTSILNDASAIDKETKLQIRYSLNRIRDIADGLLGKELDSFEKNRKNIQLNDPNGDRSAEPLHFRILSLVLEKSREFERLKKIEFIFESINNHSLFSFLQPSEFDRLISNLLNNAAEAIDGEGKVTVTLREEGDGAVILISDTGKGMDLETVAKLGKRGFTLGKEGSSSGFGLGVYHAIKTIRSLGGEISFESQVGYGTKVSIRLHKAEPPYWFASEIKFVEPAYIVVLDDDESVFELWKVRFSSFEHVKIFHFRSPDKALAWYRAEVGMSKTVIFMVEVEPFGVNVSGLDFVDRLGVTADTIVVTSRWSEVELRAICEKKRIRILPKAFISSVPLNSLMQT